MKRLLEMIVVLLAASCAVAQSPKPATPPAKPAVASAAPKSAPVSAKANSGQFPFEIVSAKRVDALESHSYGNHIVFTNKDEGGVVVVLKAKAPANFTYYGTDFSLGFDSADYASEIPRRPCIGISDDASAGPENDWDWLLGGGVSRAHTEAGKPYFAVVFEAPKNVTEFTVNFAMPLGTKVKPAK